MINGVSMATANSASPDLIVGMSNMGTDQCFNGWSSVRSVSTSDAEEMSVIPFSNII